MIANDDLLVQVYHDLMFLARRPYVSSSEARSWWTQVISARRGRQLRRFTGFVSKSSISILKGETDGAIVLEHKNRIHKTLTLLIERHVNYGENFSEFKSTLLFCEQVNVVTRKENYEILKSQGDYDDAKINLVGWEKVPKFARRKILPLIRAKCENAQEFKL